MSKIFIVCNNLLDTSRIKEALKDHDVNVLRSVQKAIEKFETSKDDSITIVLDYYTYENLDIIELISQFDDVKIVSFVPHEKIDDLKLQVPEVSFVARSRFFRNIEKYIS
jgi:hypothetical protein